MQKQQTTEYSSEVVPILLSGGVGVLPTDTLYGIVGSALKRKTVERIYALRKRELTKPMIVLIAKLDDLKLFSINLNLAQRKKIKLLWPGMVSVVIPCAQKKFTYLHRGSGSIAFRLPDDRTLLKLLKSVGPLVAPSANLAGKKPATSYAQARKYFNDEIEFYVDAGTLKSKASTIVSLGEKGELQQLRSGAVDISKIK